jgi:glycosyltransferase involved in cell wall biosynthesis
MIRILLGDASLRNRLGAAAAETARRFTWERNAAQMRDLFEKAAGQSSRR